MDTPKVDSKTILPKPGQGEDTKGLQTPPSCSFPKSPQLGPETPPTKLPSCPPSDAPPPYAPAAPSIADVSSGFSSLNLESSATPTAHQAIAHLKLLEAFHKLRNDVSHNNGLFGIQDYFIKNTDSETSQDELLKMLQEKRWQTYVTKAAYRFERWWQTVVEPFSVVLKQSDLSDLKAKPYQGPSLLFDEDNIPPLDVIMVWHAYQLSPRNFLEDCMRSGKMRAWRAGLPWAVINACIDDDTFEFNTTTTAKKTFTKFTQCSWSGDTEIDFEMKCPNCQTSVKVPWTTWDSKSAWGTSSFDWKTMSERTVFAGESTAHGVADKEFRERCSCGMEITHDLLKTQKFRSDIHALITNDVTMPGTLLNLEGIPEAREVGGRRPSLFPNRLIMGKNNDTYTRVYNKICDLLNPKKEYTATMSDIRTELESALSSKAYVEKSNNGQPIRRHQILEKVALRRMMSHYWDNSSIAGLDLAGAVIRQGSFIKKMHRLDWLHSPSLHSTMTRFLTKYARFFQILSTSKGHLAVPTLDVDLIWHTHQLSPPTYYKYAVSLTRRFINHDDKIDETKLSNGFAWTSKTYHRLFNELYSECTCWYCESVRESHTSSLSRLIGKTKHSAIDSHLDQLHAHSDSSATDAQNHISAHSSIIPTAATNSITSTGARGMRYNLELNYDKVCSRGKKKGREPPPREDDKNAPYRGDVYVPGMFVAYPACASFVAGAVGNCCSGTCGAGVAAGGGTCSGGTLGGGCAVGSSGGDGGDDGDGGDGGCGGCGGCG